MISANYRNSKEFDCRGKMGIPSTSNKRILILDDHGVVIEGIKSTLRDRASFEVRGETLNILKDLESGKALKPDIVIMHIPLPDLNGVESTRQIRELFPEARVIIYTMAADEEYVIELFKVGIFGYVLSEDPFSDLILALNVVKAGGSYFNTEVQTVLSDYLKRVEAGARQ
jgi:DNA-binding NarL/FixJ family response regulator